MKNFLKNIQIFFSYSLQSVSFLWKRNRQYLILNLLNILMTSIQVFPGMFLISSSIELLTKNVEFKEYFVIILSIIALMLVFSLTGLFLKSRLTRVKNIFQTQIRLDIDTICMNTSYENIAGKKFMENKDFALKAMENGSLDLFIESMNGVFSSVVIIGGVLVILSDVSFLMLIPVAVSLLIHVYYDYLNARQNFIDTKDDVEYRRKSSYLQDVSRNFTYAKEIRLFNLKDKFHKRMDDVDDLLFRLKENRRKRRRPSGILAYSSDTVLEISIYLYLGFLVLVPQAISLGQFSLYANALRQIKNAIGNLLFVVTNFIVNTAYLKGFFEFMKTAKEDQANRKGISGVQTACITFEHVSYRYPEAADYALYDVTITIQPQEALLIVGENGAGKTTFIKLLCGLYQPTEGVIRLNGLDISTLNQKEYASQLAAVFQDYHLFAMSIGENVSSLDASSDEARIWNALKLAGLDEKIKATSDGIHTSLYRIFDENGVEFSGGEMQRVAIARAVYKNAPVLILDEPTSALDPKAEYEIYQSFHKMSRNKTSVYVSHRLSSINFCDKIAVFEKGRIVEYGTHEQLIKAKSAYAELYSMQAGLYKGVME